MRKHHRWKGSRNAKVGVHVKSTLERARQTGWVCKCKEDRF